MSLVERFVARFGRLPTEFDPDYLEMLRMSKYRILTVPDRKPGKCANCGSTKEDGRRYVDFGLEVDFFGIVYLCSFCVGDVARNLGLFDDLLDNAKLMSQDIDGLHTQIARGNELEEKFKNMAGEVKEYFDSLHPTPDVVSIDGDDSVVTDSDKQSEPEPVKAKPRITKSTTGSGSKNLPSFAELLESSKGE